MECNVSEGVSCRDETLEPPLPYTWRTHLITSTLKNKFPALIYRKYFCSSFFGCYKLKNLYKPRVEWCEAWERCRESLIEAYGPSHTRLIFKIKVLFSVEIERLRPRPKGGSVGSGIPVGGVSFGPCSVSVSCRMGGVTFCPIFSIFNRKLSKFY